MVRTLRTPFFLVAVVALLLAFLMEIGSHFALGGGNPGKAAMKQTAGKELGKNAGDVDIGSVEPKDARPGLGIPYLAFLDGLLLLAVGLMGMSLIIPERITGRIQGFITLVVTFFVALGSFFAILFAIGLLLTMVGLFLAMPFGTLAYLAIWGFFDTGGAAATLGFVLLLKLVFAVLLVIAHQRFLENKGLVLLILTSLLANIIISFLQGFVPGILVSITDAIAAIIVGILALIWAIVLLIGSVISVVKALKIEKSSA
jgi:hypothetical protein